MGLCIAIVMRVKQLSLDLPKSKKIKYKVPARLMANQYSNRTVKMTIQYMVLMGSLYFAYVLPLIQSFLQLLSCFTPFKYIKLGKSINTSSLPQTKKAFSPFKQSFSTTEWQSNSKLLLKFLLSAR